MELENIKFRIWDKVMSQIVPWNTVKRNSFEWYEKYDHSEPETMVFEQFTGLKDSQGKDIYEGDIIEWNEDGEVLRDAVVYFGNEKYFAPYPAFDFKQDDKYVCVFPFAWIAYTQPDFHVVGNIHENADLLEDAE